MMPRLARIELFVPEEVAIVHVMNRVVRRCFLFGDDPVTGKNFDHRKVWIEDQLRIQSANFGIDLIGFAILSNHFHLIVRSRPDVVKEWSDAEVARRWLMLCPVRKTAERTAEEPNEFELNSIRNNPEKLAMIRRRLSDISWWMRLLCQHIAMRANHEDQEIGRFFQTRYKAVRLLDEAAILACAAYVDLNPIRAALAQTLEKSDFTSIQRRIETVKAEAAASSETPGNDASPGKTSTTTKTVAAAKLDQKGSRTKTPSAARIKADRFLAPVSLDEKRGGIGPVPSGNGCRASDKGFLAMSLGDYVLLLDWTSRRLVKNKRGATPETVAPILERLGLDETTWCGLVSGFGRMFYNVAGHPKTVATSSSRVSHHRYNLRRAARDLFTPTNA
jgi:hypothetical protein